MYSVLADNVTPSAEINLLLTNDLSQRDFLIRKSVIHVGGVSITSKDII